MAVPFEKENEARKLLDDMDVPFAALGESSDGESVVISLPGADVELDLETLTAAYTAPLREILG